MISNFNIRYGFATRPKESEIACGDQWFVKSFRDALLIAVIDGLGHGEYAEDSAKKIIEILDKSENDETLIDIVKHCHSSLQHSRGAVMMLAKIKKNYQVTWIGVGNILGLHWQARNANKNILLSQGGAIGFQMPVLRAESFTAAPGDLLIFASDGLQSYFIQEEFRQISPQKIADVLFKKYRKVNDDSLVFVLSWGEEDEEF